MNLEPITDILKNGTLCSIAVYGITEAIKPMIKRFTADWTKSLIRTFALCCGTACGYFLTETPEGAVTGFCGAALSAAVVAQVKSKIKGAGAPNE